MNKLHLSVALLSMLAAAALSQATGCVQLLSIEKIEPWSGGGSGGGEPSGGSGANSDGGNPATCFDTAQGESETDIDCGGPECDPCVNGQHCVEPRDCESRFCSGAPDGICTACGSEEDCAAVPGSFCDDGVCVGGAELGEACSDPVQCTSGHCVDHVCCDGECAGGCNSCALAGVEGTCTVVGDGEPGDGSCAPYLCDGLVGTCPTSCAGSQDCLPAPDAACDGNVCKGLKGPGTLCINGDECASTYCVDGVCCTEAACGADGDCEVCNNPASAGSCAPAASGADCDDGSYCNGPDACNSNGDCAPTGSGPCEGPDGDADCSESCDEDADNCSGNDADGSSCDDGAYCTGTDTCSGGACSSHTGNPCSTNYSDADCAGTCDDGANDCSGPEPSGSACNDNLYCTGTDTCNGSGSCTTHTGSPCSTNYADADCVGTCNESAGNCLGAEPSGSPCNDDVYCNGADTCSGTSCANHAGDPCPGPDNDPDCSETCDDSLNNCTGNDEPDTPCGAGHCCNANGTCLAMCA